MTWEEERPGWTRREWVKLGVTVGAVGTLGALTAGVWGQIFPPPKEFEGEVRETIEYTRFPTPQWWNSKAGTPVKVTDFELWQGATGTWRGIYQQDRWIPGTGYPVLVIRVPRDDTNFQAPTDVTLPPELAGFSLYYDDPTRDLRIVTLFDRCVHLCCYPGWHVIPTADAPNVNYSPTYSVYGQDPVYCICHASQYDPMVLVKSTNPKNNATYVGAQFVHGPANRSLPVIAVRAANDTLVGGMVDARWYVYC